MINCIGYEILFAEFINSVNKISYINILGVKGNIAVNGVLIDR